MKVKLFRVTVPSLLALLFAVTVLTDARPQRQPGRPSRRATNPASQRTVLPAPTPLPAEPSVISTAEDAAARDEAEGPPPRRTTTRRTTRRAAQEEAARETEQEALRNTVNKLTQTVTKLSDELTELRGEQRILVDLERLTRAEQRAEGLRTQLRDVTDKEFALQDRLAQIDQEMDSGAIERRAALIGSLNPSSVREQIRLSLERERERITRQLEMLATSRTRLEPAVASADQEVERIRARIDAAERQQTEADANANATGTQAAQPAPTPTDNPPAEPPQE